MKDPWIVKIDNFLLGFSKTLVYWELAEKNQAVDPQLLSILAKRQALKMTIVSWLNAPNRAREVE